MDTPPKIVLEPDYDAQEVVIVQSIQANTRLSIADVEAMLVELQNLLDDLLDEQADAEFAKRFGG